MSLTNPNPNGRWIFKNSVKLNLKKLDKPVTHKIIFDSLDIALNQVENDAITSIYNFSSNKIWIIEFKDSYYVEEISGREIDINGTIFRLEDANKIPDLRRYCTFRFHFLPTDFDNNLLKNFFNAVRIDGLKIEQILDERYKDRPERKNGVRRIRISYPKEVDNIIRSLSGPTIMYGLKCVVSIVGQKQKCYFCDEEGHNIAKCPVKDSTCERCKQKGHLTQKCSIAEKLKSLERKKVDYSELLVEQEEIQSIHEQEQIDSEEISKPNTPVYQSDSYNSTDSNLVHLTGSQIHKTPVLKDHLRDVQKSYTQDILTPVQRPSESEPHNDDSNEEKSDTDNDDDNPFESEAMSLTKSFQQGTEQFKKFRTNTVTEQPTVQNCPDIVLLNEIKIDLSETNIYFDFKNYHSITKPRNRYGGGVAILIKEGIEFLQDFSFEDFNCELLCIKLNLGKSNEISVFSLYNPPNKVLNFELFKTIKRNCRNYILCGDLNARTKQIGCLGENENGSLLEKIINELDFSVINDKCPTYNIFNRNYFEILDLFLVSSSLIDKVTDFSVLNSQDMTSDHFPIEASFSIDYQIKSKSTSRRFNYKKANWQLFRDILCADRDYFSESLSIDELNNKITKKIISASQKCIPYQSEKIYKTSLPPDIVMLIKERRKIRRNFQRTRSPILKKRFNHLTSELKISLRKFWNKN
ncbi:RNA-directed DNA polymerase from mobile element jockey-like [Brachionus plicatilis]|uniref:RNA-directed DNA polymerase from mobile element jockey-like n=1 Tax=Brachionus plicatilis TaxID=10195 RepID=A0A3M7S002_BRAPC|nr:RNA-directed DNA polymerase from mobile element jockey-like [Brachionus plicatilis]